MTTLSFDAPIAIDVRRLLSAYMIAPCNASRTHDGSGKVSWSLCCSGELTGSDKAACEALLASVGVDLDDVAWAP